MKKTLPNVSAFLPMTGLDMEQRGWSELDILLVSGDGYVDHPSFGIPLLGRWLEAHGFKVGIISQPRWDKPDDFQVMGRPRLFAGVSAGAMDSMLAHYTAFRKKRHDDAYTPGGKAGKRPNRAVSVYTSLLRNAFPGLPVIAGGIEASLRRISHYDFWTDSLRKSILADAKLDLLIYGMGELAILEVARRLEAYARSPQRDKTVLQACLAGIPGTARLINRRDLSGDALVHLPGHEAILAERGLLVQACLRLEQQVHQMEQAAVQPLGDKLVRLEAPARQLTTSEMDHLYSLPFTRQAHPSYTAPIPAATMMLASLTSHRGCGGGCSFCSLALHQGRRIAFRSERSLLREARQLVCVPGFTGAISDVGGPTANMWSAVCASAAVCTRVSCLVPSICRNFKANQAAHVDLLRNMAKLPGVRQVRVASGIRFDLALQEDEAVRAYTGEFTGGQLKIAPEHCSPKVLRLMRKPGMEKFHKFLSAFQDYSKNKKQYVVPYLMSAFPGCTDGDMREMAAWLQKKHWQPRQVQCFVPTPGTVASAMFFAEQDTQGKPIYVARTDAARLRQHAILIGNKG